ncbi:ubiquitin-NEDD8-like protein RUB2 [Vitis riparia]|uniref:ubiquitin-NEDD8-like protein RUB2 n=1 Tax=Vitis riparia TaxID=96939 RepID=UPI00155B0928|nr:ubiquitin-NEDD8-like protein RUB2 [Vitis riparia]
MDVIFEPQGGEPFSLELGFFDTVLEIKEKVQKYHGIPASRQTLFFNGHLLQDNRDIPSIQMFYNCRIQMIISPDPPSEMPPPLINIEDSPPPNNLQEDPSPPPPPPPLPPPPPSTKIQILLRIPTSKIHLSIEMDLAHTVGRLKEKIHEMEGIPVNRMVLYWRGRELQDSRSLRDCELSDRSEIDVGIKPLPASGSGSKRLKLMVMSKCGTKKVPVEVNPLDNVGELRKELEKLDQRFQFHLPPEGYFFIYKQNVMDDDRSFRWHHVGQGDTVEIFNGCVTGGS